MSKKPTAKKKPQIPLRDMLNAIDRNDLGFLDRLNDEQRNAFSSWTAMRFASSSPRAPEHHLLMVNGIVNVDFNTLRGHPGLQWRLLAVCGTGTAQQHPWIPPGKRGKKNSREGFLREHWPELGDQDITTLAVSLSDHEIRELAMDQGLDDQTIREILK